MKVGRHECDKKSINSFFCSKDSDVTRELSVTRKMLVVLLTGESGVNLRR